MSFSSTDIGQMAALVDIDKISRLAKAAGALVAVDISAQRSREKGLRSKSILDGSRSLDQILKIGLAAGVRLRRLREGTKSSTASPRSRVGRALAEVAHSAE